MKIDEKISQSGTFFILGELLSSQQQANNSSVQVANRNELTPLHASNVTLM